jgi:hypothetical protein
MAVPYTFGTATAAIPLSQLDSNFATAITLGNTAVYLGNTTSSIGNLTLTNVTISSGEVTTGNVSVAGNVTLSGGTANGVAYLNGSKVLTTGSALVFDGTNLGVGVTPSAWGGTGVKALDVAVSTSIAGSAGSADMYGNAYYNGSNFVFKANGYAFRYQQNIGSGFHAWSTSNNGTAGGTPSFTQAMTLDASGNLGVGTTSPNISGQSSSVKVVSISGTSNNWGGLELNNPSSSGGSLLGFIGWTGSNMTTGYNMPAYIGTWLASGTANKQGGELRFHTQSDNTAGATERARIDSSGNLLIGATSFSAAGNCFLVTGGGGSNYVGHANGTASGAVYTYFYYNNTQIGSITQNGTTGVLYNLTSDYRLKNDQQALTGAKDFIMALKPKKWQWWDGSGEGVGFVAHEFMEVAKYSGNGEKDAVDADGNPVYQSIQPSSSEVMANLVAFIQEQQALITQLTARITALESA